MEIENFSYSDDYKINNTMSHKCVAQQVVADESLKTENDRLVILKSGCGR